MNEPVAPQFTQEQYLAWEEASPDKYELHHGFLVAFAGGTIEHDELAYGMRKILERLYPHPCRTFGSDLKIRISQGLFFYADAGVRCEPVDVKKSVLTDPRVVCEVLSERTHAYDLIEKRAAYRTLPSLHAYVIVHTAIRRVEVDTRSADGAFRTIVYDGKESIDLADREISLDEIYGPTGSQ